MTGEPYAHEHTVVPEEIDTLGHVNNLVYLRWTQEAAGAHSTALGWPAERYRELGAGWVVRRHEITYLRPAYAGEEVVVRTWIATLGKVTSLRRYRIVRPADGVDLAIAATDWAFIDYGRGTPSRVPPEWSEDFEILGEAFEG